MLGFASLCEAPLSTLSGDAIRLEFSSLLDSNFSLDSKLSLTYFPKQTLSIDTSLINDSKLVSNVSSNLITQFDSSINSLIRIASLSTLSSSFSVDAIAYLKIISDVLLQNNIDLSLASSIKTYADSELDMLFKLDPVLSSTAFVSADLQIIMALKADFSRSNGDIVYYVVYTDKIKPFNLTIARVK